MSIWLWIPIILVGLLLAWVVFATIFLTPTEGPEGDYLLTKAYRDDPYLRRMNPVCPKCGSMYNRHVLMKRLREDSPEIFESLAWTTSFRCLHCDAEFEVSGTKWD
jgi:hypothetical protein